MKHQLFKILQKTIIPEDLENMIRVFLIAEYKDYHTLSYDGAKELIDEICELIMKKLRS